MERSWSWLSQSILHPVVYGRSVTAQSERHRRGGNLKVPPTNRLTGVGARDAHASKKIGPGGREDGIPRPAVAEAVTQ